MHLPLPPFLITLLLFLSLPSLSHAHSSDGPSQTPEAEPTICHPHSIETLTPSFFPKHNPKRLKLTYGPYAVPPMHLNNGMMEFGDLVAPPCTDCLITYIQASLSYPNSSLANASTGMWLHHTVWTNPARPPSIPQSCPTPKYPIGDRFFASGNERTPIDLTANGSIKAGYPMYLGDALAMGGELMNMRHEAQEVVLGMEFEFVDGVQRLQRRGWKKVRNYWLDVGGCWGSGVPAREGEEWDMESPSIKVGKREGGRVVFVAGHLHDGGVRAEVRRGDEVVCDSVAGYKTEGEGEHINTLSACVNVGKTKEGDEWSVKSYYDTNLHPPMRNMDGSLEPVMGIALVYVAIGGRHGHTKVKIFLGVGILVLSVLLVGLWVRLNGRDWFGRRKGVRLAGEDRKVSGWMDVGGYRDEE